MTKAEAIEREELMIGRGDLEVVDWVELQAGACVLTYRVTSPGFEAGTGWVTTRYTVYADNGEANGGILNMEAAS